MFLLSLADLAGREYNKIGHAQELTKGKGRARRVPGGNMKTGKYALVISEDAMVYEDLEILRRLPAFGSVWNDAAVVREMRSVYPTITYPAHTTMRTGCWPDRHGVINNEQTILGEVSSKWEHFNDIVRVPDIFDAAKAAGLTTCSVFWPVTGNHPHVDWLINEYWPQEPDGDPVECFAESGTDPDTLETVRRHIHMVLGHQRQHPFFEKFVFACTDDLIREHRPNLTMVHPANIDAYRHETGIFSDKVIHGLHECDVWLADMLQALDVAGIREETNVFVVSDHGQMDFAGSVHPNVLLARAGLIDVDPDGTLKGYRAICKSMGASCQVWLSDPADRALREETFSVLDAARREGVYGIERVFTEEETARLEHLSGGFSFVLETDGRYSFGNRFTGPVLSAADTSDYKTAHGTHGYLPEKGPQPTLLAFGPGIRPGARADRAGIVDIAPTVAASLGLSMPDTDGRVIEEILR